MYITDWLLVDDKLFVRQKPQTIVGEREDRVG